MSMATEGSSSALKSKREANCSIREKYVIIIIIQFFIYMLSSTAGGQLQSQHEV
jgi:hypothetical protein